MLALLSTCSLAACSLAPDYARPALPIPDSYKEQDGWATARPADDQPRGPWWEQFGDPQLNSLEAQVSSANQNIKAALARYEEARAITAAARANYFPTVTGQVYGQRVQTSKMVAEIRPITLYNDYLAGAQTSYEIDLWGRIRNMVAAAQERQSANAADLATIDLSLHAELAADYFQLRGDDAAQNVLDQTVTSYAKALVLTNQRFHGGVSPEADADQAQLQLQNAKTQAADIRLKRAQLEHAIAVLTGQVPAAFSLPPTPLDPATAILPPIAAALPSTLLERRPDIAFYERLVAAANSDIGVARAAWFPAFSLNGSIGFESAGAANWLTAPSRFWSLGPSAALTLFDAGRIEALSDEAHAAYDEAAANYRQTVLAAYQDVEDNLAALRQLAQESVTQTAATAAAQRTLQQSENRYSGGVATYLDIVVAQNQALQAQLNSVDVLVKRLNASVLLVKALGGGWQANEGDALAERTVEQKKK